MRASERKVGLWIRVGGLIAAATMLGGAQILAAPVSNAASGTASSSLPARGELDCNGHSTIQQSIKVTLPCTDPHGANGARFYDNGYYVGHDEPNLRFISTATGSGDNVSWTQTLPIDPAALPTVASPGSDVTHFFQLSVAPWFSMAICDPNSYPQTSCTPQSNSNAPSGSYPGGGSAFMELQFYPPGFAPFVNSISCNIPGSTTPLTDGNGGWCAALTIDSLECTNNFAYCNPACTEPVNFAFIQKNGVPTGPPSPQQASYATFTPNRHTLFFNPGDTIKTQIFDNRKAGALEAVLTDQTTGQSGYMIASAANGFQNTNLSTCAGSAFNFQPEYNTAAYQNIVPWAALSTDISTTFEIGHFTACSSLSDPVNAGTTGYNTCKGAYESATAPDGTQKIEAARGDGPCFYAGDTHGGTASGGETTAPNLVTGCDNFNNGGDLDYDGSPYWKDWPNSNSPNTFPSTMVIQPPTSGRRGSGYSQVEFESDNPASDYQCNIASGSGCTVPPPGPGAFYPYWTQVTTSSAATAACDWEFGNMTNGNTFGGPAQYGTPGNSGNGYNGTDGSNPINLNAQGCATS
ncbi:MAG: hypothetical protein ACYCUD_00530 [Candidatus Dormibacteria bacterium]